MELARTAYLGFMSSSTTVFGQRLDFGQLENTLL